LHGEVLILIAHVVIPVIQEASMLAVRLDIETETRLAHLSRETGHSKSYYVKQAIDAFLEDREDYLLALDQLPQCIRSILQRHCHRK
jgi:RHH-type rel operon transcriptional repressor/antitoxin RelB